MQPTEKTNFDFPCTPACTAHHGSRKYELPPRWPVGGRKLVASVFARSSATDERQFKLFRTMSESVRAAVEVHIHYCL